jgi:hypothetical protein
MGSLRIKIGLQEARKRKVRRESLYYLLYYFRGIIPLPLTLCFHPLAFFLSNSVGGQYLLLCFFNDKFESLSYLPDVVVLLINLCLSIALETSVDVSDP